MGFFDPAYRKMLDKSPAYFRNSASVWGSVIEMAVIAENAAAAGDLFRASVIGKLAIRAAREDPTNWSNEAVDYISMATKNADRLLPPQLVIASMVTATTIYRMADDTPPDPDVDVE